jgi:hypothetical protein
VALRVEVSVTSRVAVEWLSRVLSPSADSQQSFSFESGVLELEVDVVTSNTSIRH